MCPPPPPPRRRRGRRCIAASTSACSTPRRGCTSGSPSISGPSTLPSKAGTFRSFSTASVGPRSVLQLVTRRLVATIPTLFGVLVVSFLLLNVVPGDPVAEMVGERADSATIARLRAELHLDEPIAAQFGHYVWGVVRGDLGRSYITQRPVLGDLLERFPKTLQLAGAAMLLAATCGITLGAIAGIRPGGLVDRFSMLLAYVGISFPVYWVGLLLILLFAVALRWLPPSGYGGIAFLVLPALTLGMRSIAFLARMTRGAMLEVLPSDFVRTARAKGVTERRVIGRHALRNALLPIITVLGLDVGNYLTGSILTETVFSWPGVGRCVLLAIERRDLPAVQGSILFMSVIFVLVNLLTDVLYAKADPRIALRSRRRLARGPGCATAGPPPAGAAAVRQGDLEYLCPERPRPRTAQPQRRSPLGAGEQYEARRRGDGNGAAAGRLPRPHQPLCRRNGDERRARGRSHRLWSRRSHMVGAVLLDRHARRWRLRFHVDRRRRHRRLAPRARH